MTAFRYRAIAESGEEIRGDVRAETQRSAVRTLERRGLRVLALAEAPETKPAWFERVGRPRLSETETLAALQELATLVGSGIPLVDAIDAQASGLTPGPVADAFGLIGQSLRRGEPLSQALARTALPLPRVVTTLVAAGERTGRLGEALRDAVAQVEYSRRVRAEIKQALIYPSILMAAGLGAVILMFGFVVPRFSNLLERAEDLPWLAWAVLSTGTGLRQHWLPATAALTGLAIAGWHGWRNARLRRRLQERLMSLPLLGPWWLESQTAEWSRLLGTLLQNGVPLLDALELSRSTAALEDRSARLGEVQRAVRGGTPLTEALEQQQLLKPSAYNLLRVGERTGRLAEMLASLATLCEESGRARMKRFLALLEPMAILVMGVVIGTIMIGVILGITSANDLAI